MCVMHVYYAYIDHTHFIIIRVISIYVVVQFLLWNNLLLNWDKIV